MDVVAIIQARIGSSRLPGKVLADLGGRSMLAQVLRRVGRAESLRRLVVATSISAADDPIEQECRRLGAVCFRGPEEDVLARYHQAAVAHRAEAVLRITADCPLVDPGVIDLVVGRFLAERPDYASNTLRRTFPRGLDAEVFTAAALKQAFHGAVEPYQRAHVTPYLHQHPQQFRLLAVTGEVDYSKHRWTVDTAEDLALVRAIGARLADGATAGWRDVLRLVADEPALAAMNRNVHQKTLLEG